MKKILSALIGLAAFAAANIAGASFTPPGGTNGQIQFNSNNNFGGYTQSGDCTTNTTTGVITCTKSNGVAFGTAAFQNVATFLQTANNLSDLANASTARTNLGLVIGTNVEAWSATLDTLAATGITGSQGNGLKVQRSTGTTTTNNCARFDANGNTVDSGSPCGSGSGSVTSVGMTGDGTVYNATVPGSPVTTAGTLAPTLHTQSANALLAGPTTGSAAAPTFRAIVQPDLPGITATGDNTARQLADYFTDARNVKNQGATCDGVDHWFVSTVGSSNVIADPDYAFSARDITAVGLEGFSTTTGNALNTGTAIATITSINTGTAVTVARPINPGSGFNVGETINLDNGTVLTVASTVSNAGVGTATVTTPGGPWTSWNNPVAMTGTSGTGSGATFNIQTTSANLSINMSTTKTTSARMVWWFHDDTAAINNMLINSSYICQGASCYNPYGGNSGNTVEAPAGVCAFTQIVPQANVTLHGRGMLNTELFQIGGSNVNAVQSVNFSSLTNTGANYGTNPLVPSFVGLSDMTIDGGRPYNTAGHGLALYGNALQLKDSIMVRGAANSCMYTEAAAAGAYNSTDPHAQEEGNYGGVWVRNCGDYGWLNRGPKDFLAKSFIAYDWGHNSSSFYGYYADSSSNFNGGGFIGVIHPYVSASTPSHSIFLNANTTVSQLYGDFGNVVLNAGDMKIDKFYALACAYGSTSPCLSVASNGNTINQFNFSWQTSGGTLPTGMIGVDVEGSQNTINGGWSTDIASTVANNTLFKIRGARNRVTATVGNMTGTGDVCFDLGGSNNTLNENAFNCATFISYVGTSNNTINSTNCINACGGSGNVAFSGTLNATDTYNNKDETTNGTFNQTPSTRFTGAIPALSNGFAGIGGTSTLGGIFSGQGSVNDWTMQNKNGTSVCLNPTGTTTMNCTALQQGGVAVPTTSGAIVSGDIAVWSGTSGLLIDGGSSAASLHQNPTFIIPGTLVVGTNVASNWVIMPKAGTINKAWAIAQTAPTGQALIFDILKSTDNGATFTSIWNATPANRIQIAATQSAGNQTAFDTTTFNAGDVFRIDIIQIGSGAAGANANVMLATTY